MSLPKVLYTYTSTSQFFQSIASQPYQEIWEVLRMAPTRSEIGRPYSFKIGTQRIPF